MEPIFRQKRSAFSRLFVVVLLTVVFLTADSLLLGRSGVRWLTGTLAYPFQEMGIFPSQAIDSVKTDFATREQLVIENARLKASQRILEAKVQKLATVTAENTRLRALLNSSALLGDDELVVTELVGISPDPILHEVTVNKGDTDDVSVGQAVLDASGLMGQVTEVYRSSARVMLITDQRHQVPVQVNRNGLRVVVGGMGLRDKLSVLDVSATADIRVGDLLVSSGLAGRFPLGYPVARVASIEPIPNSPFLTVTAQPMAQLSRSRHLLLVFPQDD